MSGFWWACKTCGVEMYNSQHVHVHRNETGHIGARLVTNDCPPPSSSTREGRARARRIYAETRAALTDQEASDAS